MTAVEVQKSIDTLWGECERPPPSHALDKLRELSGIMDSLHADVSSMIRIPPRPTIPPAKKPPKAQSKAPPQPPPPPVKPVDVVPNHQQRKVIADKLSRSSAVEMRRAWEVLRPFIDKNAQERQTISLNELPDPVLIELKRIVLS
jgi:hypothetical protein